MSAIADLSAWVKDSLSKPKCPLYTIYVDFTKAFDSIDRSRLFAKLNDMGVSATFIKALWPIFKQNNFQVILPNQSLSDPITQTLGVPQGQCLSPHLYTLYTADMPAILKGGDDYLQCLVYADDLAICSNNLCAMQQSIDRLYKYCSDNYLGINIGKTTKIMKFRRGGHLAKSDVITCNSNPIEFVSKFTYLGVVFQTKGKLTGHFDHLRNKGIAACAKVAARMLLSKMSPAILARLFLAVVLPSATYGLRSIHTNETLDFLDEVQGRLIKAWFGVSKYCSTSSLRTAIGWRKASEFHLSTSAEPKCILDPLLPIPLHLPAHSRRNMGLWYSNGLHHLWCCTPSCYTINNSCICRLCGERQPTKSHLLSCRTSTLASHIVITPMNINKVVNVLYVI